jgi:hypothetical protein
MALAIAGAAIDVARVRRARRDLLSAAPLDESGIYAKFTNDFND